jgi:hypothetical protein
MNVYLKQKHTEIVKVVTCSQWKQQFENQECSYKRFKGMAYKGYKHASEHQAVCIDKCGVFACSTTFSRAHSKVLAFRDPQSNLSFRSWLQ